MCVAKTQALRAWRQHHHRLQHHALNPRHLRIILARKARAHDDVHRLRAQTLNHGNNILDLVLAVRVKGDKVLRTRLRACIFNTRLNRRALAQVHRVVHQMRTGSVDGIRRVIARTIIDRNDVGERLASIRNDVENHLALIETRNDKPGVAEIRECARRIHRRDTLVALSCHGGIDASTRA